VVFEYLGILTLIMSSHIILLRTTDVAEKAIVTLLT